MNSNCKFSWIFTTVIAFASLWGACAETQGQGIAAKANPLPHYVVGPPNSSKINQGLCFRELFEKPDQWEKARALTDALLYSDMMFKDFSDEELKTWFAQMHQWKIKLELEVGAIKEWGVTGENTFRIQKPKWDRIQSLGGGYLFHRHG